MPKEALTAKAGAITDTSPANTTAGALMAAAVTPREAAQAEISGAAETAAATVSAFCGRSRRREAVDAKR